MPRRIHKPTQKDRDQVKALAGFGTTEDRIAMVIGIAPKTLRKYYRAELDTAHTMATAQVARGLYENATTHNNVTAQIFWMKTRGGWREKEPQQVQVEHSGAVGIYDLKKVSNADLKRLKDIIRAARRDPAVDDGGDRGGGASA